ncbi:glycosyltransferase family 4 protein [Bradyrhizobium diazoefficiens]|nr:glycosyltransferase family 4 protein [Bradyrhizobium diazoefficiens]MBR0850297.1 glycosyltransferase family 4 protein [Bradyrhizobium diazoefficiens]
MKILHFYKTYFPDSRGGIEQFIYQLAHGSGARGMEIDVLSLSSDVANSTSDFGNHLSHRVHKNFEIASTGFSLEAFKRFSELARRADIVHYHYPWPFADVVYFATAVKRPSVLTYHSDIVRQVWLMKLYRPLMTRFLRSVDRIVATSPNYLQTSDVLDLYRDKTEVIPIGLDRSTYPRPTNARLEKWRRQVGEQFFLFVGVLRYYKGLHVLLDALQGTSYEVVIVGAGPIESELKLRASQLGLTNIRFLGPLPDADKAALLELSCAVLFPSNLRSEAFGITLLEGAMFGKPLISSEIGTGTSFINIHGETGLVVPPNDPVALRGAMRDLSESPALAADMGRRAYERYDALFTADRMVDRYIELYRELLSGGG